MNPDVAALVGRFSTDIDMRLALGSIPNRISIADKYPQLSEYLTSRQKVVNSLRFPTLSYYSYYLATISLSNGDLFTFNMFDNEYQYRYQSVNRADSWTVMCKQNRTTRIHFNGLWLEYHVLTRGGWVVDP
jgi:hypothetical protein